VAVGGVKNGLGTMQAQFQKGRFARSLGVVLREVAGETVVVPIRGGLGDLDCVYTFNKMGAQLWRMVEEGRTAQEMATWAAGRYEVDAEAALTDVQKFLASLEQEGLIAPL